jgi:hypothetical protein
MTNDRLRPLRAESTGSVAESSVRGVLTGRGYAELTTHEVLEGEPVAEQTAMFRDFARRPWPARLFVAQYPIGASIYGLPLNADFWVRGAPHLPNGLAIEVKWQQSTGSVDEKFPYLVHNIKECYPCAALVIADGGGQRPGALRWLRDQVGGNLMGVFSLAVFLAWANRNL